jgi:hypothetical protein
MVRWADERPCGLLPNPKLIFMPNWIERGPEPRPWKCSETAAKALQAVLRTLRGSLNCVDDVYYTS